MLQGGHRSLPADPLFFEMTSSLVVPSLPRHLGIGCLQGRQCVPEQAHAAQLASLCSSLQAGREPSAGDDRVFLSLVGAPWRRRMLAIWQCQLYSGWLFLGFCSFSFSCPPGPLPPWSLCSLHVIFCLCLCHAHTLGAALPPRKDSQDWLAQILSIQDPLSASCSMTPSPIQQPFIHSCRHSFKCLSETCSRSGTMPGMGVQRQVRSRLCF